LERDTLKAANADLEAKFEDLVTKSTNAKHRYQSDYKRWKDYFTWSDEQDAHHRVRRNRDGITKEERKSLDAEHFSNRMDGLRAFIPDVERFGKLEVDYEAATPRPQGPQGVPSTAAIMAASTVKASRKARDRVSPPSSPSFFSSKTATRPSNTEGSQGTGQVLVRECSLTYRWS
jgi:hypothetical protein